MLLEVLNLTVHYGGARCIDDVSLNVQKGEIVTIIGSNGAGKTTILRTIAGLKKATSGTIRLNGTIIDGTPAQHIVKEGIAHVQQGRNLFPYMTVIENLKLGAYLRSDKDGIERDLENIYNTFPRLEERQKQQAHTLSGGEQQMLAIARALMGNPTLLLLDEPSIGLAPIVVKEIGKVALEINKMGTSIILVEQNAILALKLANRGYVMETGNIVLEGKGDELVNDERVKKAYLGQELAK